MTFPPTIEKVKASPAYQTAIWDLEPSQSGILRCGTTRGTPADISWEVHGEGPTKVILIPGLGIVKSDFQNQTLFFGHKRNHKYSLLLVDNRGLGGSAQVRGYWTSTHHMALDILKIADHLGWTAPRQLHVAGGSMGGMIAQELAFTAPDRVASLTLWSTTAKYENVGTGFWGLWDGLRKGVNVIIPKTLEGEMRHIAGIAYAEEWLRSADDVELPGPGTIRCNLPRLTDAHGGDVGEGEFLRFENNYERFVAMEVRKRETPGSYTMAGFLMQAVAASFHCKSAEQLGEMAGRVGRERIMIVHGTLDVAMPLVLGEKLMVMVKPGKKVVVGGLGHAPIHEKAEWFNELLAEHFDSAGRKD